MQLVKVLGLKLLCWPLWHVLIALFWGSNWCVCTFGHYILIGCWSSHSVLPFALWDVCLLRKLQNFQYLLKPCFNKNVHNHLKFKDPEYFKDLYYTRPLVQLTHDIFQENWQYFNQHIYFHVHFELLDRKRNLKLSWTENCSRSHITTLCRIHLFNDFRGFLRSVLFYRPPSFILRRKSWRYKALGVKGGSQAGLLGRSIESFQKHRSFETTIDGLITMLSIQLGQKIQVLLSP